MSHRAPEPYGINGSCTWLMTASDVTHLHALCAGVHRKSGLPASSREPPRRRLIRAIPSVLPADLFRELAQRAACSLFDDLSRVASKCGTFSTVAKLFNHLDRPPATLPSASRTGFRSYPSVGCIKRLLLGRRMVVATSPTVSRSTVLEGCHEGPC